jgi:hypothetical protein
LYQPWKIDGDGCGAIGGMDDSQGKPKYAEETFGFVGYAVSYLTDLKEFLKVPNISNSSLSF